LHGRLFTRIGTTETELSATGTTTFTQQNLMSGQVFYKHLGDLATSDSVVLYVSDAANEVSPDAVFSITITGTLANPTLTLTDPGIGGFVVLEGDPAIRISPAALGPGTPNIVDGDSVHFREATLEAQFLTLTNGDDGLTGDVLSVMPQAANIGVTPGIAISSNTITYTLISGASFVLGTIDPTLNGQNGRKLLIRFSTAVATNGAEVITTDSLAVLIANVGYACTANQPVTRTRRLVLTLNEKSPNPGTGSVVQNITITPVNDAPVFTVPNGAPLALTTLIDVPVVARVLAVDTDLPTGATLTYDFVAPPTSEGSLVFNATTGAFSFTPAATATSPVTFTATVTDDQNASSAVPATVSITVLPALGGTPPLVISDPLLEVQEGDGIFQVLKIDLNGATGGPLIVSLVGNKPPNTALTVSPSDPLTWLLTCPAVERPSDGCWCFGLHLVVGANSGYSPITLSVRSLSGSN
jgi:hypothetical protein